MDPNERIVRVEMTQRQLALLIQSVKSGRVEFTERAAILANLENARDTDMYGHPLVQRGGRLDHWTPPRYPNGRD